MKTANHFFMKRGIAMNANQDPRKNRNLMNYEDEYLKYIWKYFSLHANQRIVLFRFYLVFFSLYVLASAHLVGLFHKDTYGEEIISIFLSLFFILISVIFWTVDSRNRNLIHNAEDAFRSREKIFNFQPSDNGFAECKNTLKIFTIENQNKPCFMCHTFCFRVIFFSGIILSIIFIGFSFYNMSHNYKTIDYRLELSGEHGVYEVQHKIKK